MVQLLRRAGALGLILSLFITSDAAAATIDVNIEDFEFSDDVVRLRPGDSVRWENEGPSSHTATSTAPFSLWDSGILPLDALFRFQFIAAGTYPYFCQVHPPMTGQVQVVPRARPGSGPAGTQFRVTVASVVAPAGFVYDVQKRDPGGAFQDFAVGITARQVNFDSTGQPAGEYEFRSRMRKTADDSASGYSLPARAEVTA
jgi:plastocyanin